MTKLITINGKVLDARLIRGSIPYADPLIRIDWDSLSLSDWWLPQAALSLCGNEAFESLPEAVRKRVSHLEFINFIEKALWLEGIFMTRISRGLADSLGDPTATTYRLHELREEAGHSLMFLELIRSSSYALDTSLFWRPRLATWVGRYAPYQSPIFWLAAIIGEQVPDQMNHFIRRHRQEISPAIYAVITTHTIDEARHIAHAYASFQGSLRPGWKSLLRAYPPLLNRIFCQFVEAFFYPTPALYEYAGLKNGVIWRRRAIANPRRNTFIETSIQSTIDELGRHGVEVSWRMPRVRT